MPDDSPGGARIFSAMTDGQASKLLQEFKRGLPKDMEFTDLGLEMVFRGFDQLDDTKLELGIVGENASRPSSDGRLTMGELGIINEFGSKNMHVPARHFVTGTITSKQATEEAAKVLDATINMKNVDSALDAAGRTLSEKIRERIYRGDFQGNASSTIKKKGFDHPLMDTSALADAINYRIVHGEDTVDAGAGGEDYAAFNILGD